MPRQLSFCLFCLLPALLQASELDGRYRATLDGQPAEMILRSQGQQVEGEYVENAQLRLNIQGKFDGQLLRAQIRDPQSGDLIANMNANYANAMLNTRIVARSPHNGAVLQREALFQRQDGDAASLTPTTDTRLRDPALVGIWVHEGMPDSAAMASRMTLRLAADGRVTQWLSQIARGRTWNPADPGELLYRGHWKTVDGLLLVQLKDQDDYQPAAFYRLDSAHLVTTSNTGELLWQRR